MDKEYITDYINLINKSLGINVSVSVEEAVLTRYALYGYCVGNKMYCWSELFERLDGYLKNIHIIHAYALLMDADISRRVAINSSYSESVKLLLDPNKLAKDICKMMNITYVSFDYLQRTSVYKIKSNLFPFPNPKGTFFKVGDEIRSGLTKFKISDIFYDENQVMVTAQSLNRFIKLAELSLCLKPK